MTDDVFELKFETASPFSFQAGQYISIKITDNPASPCFRAYSISSSPQNANIVELCVKFVEGGRASTWLKSLNEGMEIDFLGPIGKFILKNAKENILFVATGTGVAPFKAIIEDELAKGNQKEMTLMFGVRHFKDIFYKEFFENLAAKHPNFHLKITLSRPESDNWNGNTGRVTDLLQTATLDSQNTEVYICGLKDMIESVTTLLKEKNFPDEAVNFEKYD